MALSGTAVAAGGGEGQGEDDGELSVSTAAGAISVYAGEPKTISFTATGLGDAAASTNLYLVANDVESAVGGFASVENGVITISPTKADAGEKTLRLKVTTNDGEANEASAYADIAVTTLVRVSAVTAESASVTAYVGSATMVNFTFTDDVGALSTNCTCGTEGVSQESWTYTDGVLTYTPAAGDVALSPVSFTVSITGTDNCGDPVDKSATVTVTVEEPLETLVTWTIESESYTAITNLEANSPLHASLTSAVVSRGTGAPAAGGQGTFGAKNFNVTTFEVAKGLAKYLEVAFDVAANYSLTPAVLEYELFRSGAGPTNFCWTCSTNGIDFCVFGNIETFGVSGTETKESFSLDLSSLGTLPMGVGATLRLYAWGTSNSSGTFCFNKNSIVLRGYAEKDSAVFVPPSIGGIEDQVVYVGDTNSVAVSFAGSMEYAMATNFVADSENVSGECWIADGVAYYAPTAEDALLAQPLRFVVTLSVVKDEEKMDSTAYFNVMVREKPVLRIAKGGVLKENFDSMGTDATATLPEAWRVAATSEQNGTNALSYADAGAATSSRATNNRGEISINNADIYNMGTNAEDRAVGFLSSGNKAKTCALMVPVKNVGVATLERLWISYSVEKWRNGNAKTLALCLSRDGEEWTEVGGDFKLATETDLNAGDGGVDTTTLALGADPTIKRISGKVTLAMPLAPDEVLYLGWFYLRALPEDEGSKAQALAIDDVEIAAGDIKMTTFVVQ